jgi:hypothetical protein
MAITEKEVLKTATKLSADEIQKGKVLSVKWTPKLKYAWDNGPAIGRYLAELKNGKILLSFKASGKEEIKAWVLSFGPKGASAFTFIFERDLLSLARKRRAIRDF